MNTLQKLILLFVLTTPTYAFDEYGFEDGLGDGNNKNSQHYTDATQEILRQVRSANARKAKAQVYYVKKDAKNVYAYSSARSAAVRLDSPSIKEESKIAITFKPEQKVKIIPLDCGIGYIKRKKKPSPLFVVMSNFESEEERNQRISNENAPQPRELQIGMAQVSSEVIMLFDYSSDCKKAQQYSRVGEAELKQWLSYVLDKKRGLIISKGEEVMIIEIDGTYAKVLYNNSEWWTSSEGLKMK